MPQVHAVLLEQLDLVPSRGGIEAAGLRFMQLQVGSQGLIKGVAVPSILSYPAAPAVTTQQQQKKEGERGS